MTAEELIEKLKTLPKDTIIVTPGYEGGYNDVKGTFENIKVALNYNSEWYYGPHEPIGSYLTEDMVKEKCKISSVTILN